ncbi:hypothetical protein V2J09_020568 [Rumex salicifolius]
MVQAKEMPCEVVESSKETVVNSTNVDLPATDSSCDHFQGKKMCNLHDGQGHSLSLAPKPSLKKKKMKTKKRSYGQVILHDPEHIKRYKSLGNRTVLNTCYMDDEMLDALGIPEDIEWMAEQVGWTQFLTVKEPTYVSLTLEFPVGWAKKGVNVIGGLITSIARYLGIDMEGLKQARGKVTIGIPTCKLTRMVEEDEDCQYKLKLNGINALWPLPDPANTTVRVQENWKRTLEAKQREVDEIKSKVCQISSKSSRKG